MEFTGKYHLAAKPDAVWAGLNDPDVLRACIPGCEKLEKTSPTEFTAAATLKIGPMTARFGGRVSLTEIDAPHRCTIVGEGSGVTGFAKGAAVILLAEADDGTDLSYIAKAAIGGKLAQIGQRLLDGTARQIADDFFRRFAEKVAPALAPDPTSAEIEVLPLVPAEPVPQRSASRGSGVWIVGLVAIAVILLALFWLVL